MRQVEDGESCERRKESAVTGTKKMQVISGLEGCRKVKGNEGLQRDIGFSSAFRVTREAGQSY